MTMNRIRRCSRSMMVIKMRIARTPIQKTDMPEKPYSAAVSALLFAETAAEYGFSGMSVFWMGVLAILILITIIDLEHRLILFIVMIPSYVYALIGAILFNHEISDKIVFRDYLFGG